MSKLSKRAARIVDAGRLLNGDTRWQSPMARLCALSPALVQKISDGSRDVTDDVYRKVAEALLKEADRLRKAAGTIEKMAGRMHREMEE